MLTAVTTRICSSWLSLPSCHSFHLITGNWVIENIQFSNIVSICLYFWGKKRNFCKFTEQAAYSENKDDYFHLAGKGWVMVWNESCRKMEFQKGKVELIPK